jgi:hypothetical protein
MLNTSILGVYGHNWTKLWVCVFVRQLQAARAITLDCLAGKYAQ